MKRLIPLCSVILLVSSIAGATMQVGEPIQVTNGVPAWDAQYGALVDRMKAEGTYPADGYTECREVSEIPGGVFLCLSNTQRGMNSALGRASFFIEGTGGTGTKGAVVKQTDSSYQELKTQIGGHDLRGEDLLRFNDAVTAACEKSNGDQNTCHNLYEKDIFENFIVPMARKHPNFVVITFAHSSNMRWSDVVTHEILHAQYFNEPEFREVCDNYWKNEMTEAERASVRRSLAAYYDSNDELLMMNEFQAYMLMAGAQYSQLASYVPKHRAKLLQELAQRGLKPVEIK